MSLVIFCTRDKDDSDKIEYYIGGIFWTPNEKHV